MPTIHAFNGGPIGLEGTVIKHLRLSDDSALWLFLDSNCPFVTAW